MSADVSTLCHQAEREANSLNDDYVLEAVDDVAIKMADDFKHLTLFLIIEAVFSRYCINFAR
jgi:hypothetical protein